MKHSMLAKVYRFRIVGLTAARLKKVVLVYQHVSKKNRELDSHTLFAKYCNRKHNPDKFIKFRESNDIIMDPWTKVDNKFYSSSSVRISSGGYQLQKH